MMQRGNRIWKSLWRTVALTMLCVAVVMPAAAQSDDAPADKMDWWREARFGMFIHWGLYSIPAGIWNGEGVHSNLYKHPFCEHIMLIAQIPIAEYEKLADQFHPDDWDADAIAKAP